MYQNYFLSKQKLFQILAFQKHRNDLLTLLLFVCSNFKSFYQSIHTHYLPISLTNGSGNFYSLQRAALSTAETSLFYKHFFLNLNILKG